MVLEDPPVKRNLQNILTNVAPVTDDSRLTSHDRNQISGEVSEVTGGSKKKTLLLYGAIQLLHVLESI